jgi:hypothetical protein
MSSVQEPAGDPGRWAAPTGEHVSWPLPQSKGRLQSGGDVFHYVPLVTFTP